MEPETPSKSKNQVMGRVKNYRVLKISISLMIILLLLVGGYIIYDPNSVQYVSGRGSHSYYTVVVDCGSTGTRVNVYEWLMEGGKSDKRSLPVLMHMYPDNVTKSESCQYHCMQTEPGLDKFVGNATGVRGSLEPLIYWAEQWVPVGRRSETPIFVLATAGMRRLVEEDARRILQDVESVVKQHGFMHRKSWIRVLSGREEAYFGWVALNYKMGVLGNSSRMSTLGLLDLGGSSLQLVAEADGLSEGEHVLKSQVGALKHRLLAYSLPSFGLNEAFDRTVVMLSHSQALRENADIAFEVRHPCLGSGFSRNYTCNGCFGRHSSTTSENSRNELSSIFLLGNPDWDICRALVRAAANNASNLELSYVGPKSSCNGLSSYEGNKLLILTKASQSVSRYHALSAFFAVYSIFNLGPSANVTSMWERGEQLCSAAWVNTTIPHGGLHCFRAAYITSLIEDVLCLSSNAKILFGPGDISWTLGAALVEGVYQWINNTNNQTNWRLSLLDVKEMMMSSPFIIFVLLCCLLVIVYYSRVMLPMPGTKRRGVIGTAGRSSSLPSLLGLKHQP